MAQPIFANLRYLSTWANGINGAGLARSRHDYDTPEHLLAEMMNERYWGPILSHIEAGDLMWITDGANEQTLIRFNELDKPGLRAMVSVVSAYTEKPITATEAGADNPMTVRNKGPRGGKWCVLDKDGAVLVRDCVSRAEAERQMANLLDKAA